MKKFSFGFALTTPVLLGLACAAQSGAMTLTFASGVHTTDSSTRASCDSPYTQLTYQECATYAFISPDLASSGDIFMNLNTFGGGGEGLSNKSFATAFSSTLGPSWTLAQGDMSALSGVTLTVTEFKTSTTESTGGIGPNDLPHGINITVAGLSQTLANQLVWIQGLEVNYKPGTSNASYNTAINYNTLDDATFNSKTAGCTTIPYGSPATLHPSSGGTLYCDPIYPFQYSDHKFYDAPMGSWPNASFRGIALLATIDPLSKKVTTYAGISYGFDNRVAPEPGTWVLMLAGAVAIFFGRRRLAARV